MLIKKNSEKLYFDLKEFCKVKQNKLI